MNFSSHSCYHWVLELIFHALENREHFKNTPRVQCQVLCLILVIETQVLLSWLMLVQIKLSGLTAVLDCIYPEGGGTNLFPFSWILKVAANLWTRTKCFCSGGRLTFKYNAFDQIVKIHALRPDFEFANLKPRRLNALWPTELLDQT